jgi:hypothetical protein
MAPGGSSPKQRIHFDLSGHEPDAQFMFHAGLNDYPIRAHTERTLEESRTTNRFLRLLPDEAVSHYIDIDPPQYVSMLYSTKAVTVDGIPARQMTTMGIFIPKKAWMRDIDRGLRTGAAALEAKLACRNLGENVSSSLLEALANAPDEITTYQDAFEVAAALIFQHPELINLNKDAAKGGPVTVYDCVSKALNMKRRVVEVILKDHPRDWSTVERVLDDGKPAVDDQGKPIFTTGLDPEVRRALGDSVSLALQLAHQSEDLRGQTWTLQYGMTTAGYSGDVRPKKALANLPLRGPNDVRWRLKNLTPSSGLTFEPEIRFRPAPAGNVWRADGEWASNPDPMVEPYDDAARKALADGKLHVVIDQISGPLVPVPSDNAHYTVTLSSSTSTKKASGDCWIRAEGGALQYAISTSDGPVTAAYFAIDTGGSLKKVHAVSLRDVGSCGEMTIVAKNHWLRHLAAYVEYLDASGKVQPPPNWAPRFPVPNTVFDANDNKRFVALVDPCETVMGIPLPADSTHLTVPVPQNAFMIRVSWGGLGSGADDSVACPAGAAMTIIVEMAFPVMMLAIGAALTASGGLLKIVKEKPVYGALLAGAGVGYVAGGSDWRASAWNLTKKLLPAIGKGLLGKGIETYIAKKIGEGAAKRAIPFINLAMFVVDAAATAAQLGQTTAAVVQSPAVHTTEVTRTIGLQVVITSSRVYKKFPDPHHHLAVVVAYDSGATLPALIRELPKETISDDMVVLFEDIPASGNLRVMVFFYADNNWQSGQGASPWIKAEGTTGSTTLRTSVEIDVNEAPLGEWSIYQHQEKIKYVNGEHVWRASEPPDAVKSTDSKISKLHGITVAQYSEMVGYSWQAKDLTLPPDDPSKPPVSSDLYALQNLSVLQHPEQHYGTPPIAFTSPPGIAYDVVSPDDGSGRNFWIDPVRGIYDEATNPKGGFYLRHIELNYYRKGVNFAVTPASWGRFPDRVDAMVVHPHGNAYAIQRGLHKIYRLALPPAAVPDDKAPLATMFSGLGKRHGLVNKPIAIALALDGRVVVLESGNERVQCFDVNGNPVAYFTDPVTQQKSPVLDVSGVARKAPRITEYLDMAVEAKGHIFILCAQNQGRKASDYRVDLYDPSGKFLATTPNFAAARLTVDLLRNLFALNYEVLQGKNGPEPSISHWLPPAPPPTPPPHKEGGKS